MFTLMRPLFKGFNFSDTLSGYQNYSSILQIQFISIINLQASITSNNMIMMVCSRFLLILIFFLREEKKRTSFAFKPTNLLNNNVIFKLSGTFFLSWQLQILVSYMIILPGKCGFWVQILYYSPSLCLLLHLGRDVGKLANIWIWFSFWVLNRSSRCRCYRSCRGRQDLASGITALCARPPPALGGAGSSLSAAFM